MRFKSSLNQPQELLFLVQNLDTGIHVSFAVSNGIFGMEGEERGGVGRWLEYSNIGLGSPIKFNHVTILTFAAQMILSSPYDNKFNVVYWSM